MSRQEEWQPVLDREIKRWSAKSSEGLVAELAEEQVYEVAFRGGKVQVEVTMPEDTETYLHIGISVDDGVLPAALRPLTSTFIRRK